MVERTPTAELVAPTWLAAEAQPSPADAWRPHGAERVSFVAAAGAGVAAGAEGDDAPESSDSGAAGGVDETQVLDEPWVATTSEADERPTAVLPPTVEPVATEPAEAAPVQSQEPDKKRRGRGAVIGLVAVALLGGVYVGAAALMSSTVPRGTSALGVDIGGMSTGQAIAAVNDAADERASDDVVVSVDGDTGTVVAGEAGLGVDAQATVEALVGFSLDPALMWSRIVGGGDADVVATVDQDALQAGMEDVASQLDSDPVDAVVEIVGTAAIVTPGATGVIVDSDATAAVVSQAWPDALEVDGVAEITEPAITDADAQAFANTTTKVTLAGPVTLASAEGDVSISAEDIADNATVETADGVLTLVIDGAPIAADVVDANPDLVTEPQDAKLSFDDSQKLKVTKGVEGQDVDAAAMGAAIVDAANSTTRSGELPVTVTEPEVTSEDLGVDDLNEVVASFDTPLTNEYIRTQNLITAAADVEGTVVLPGEEFNLAQTLAPVTVEEGYAEAHVIVDGVLTNGMGGGLSQMATTAYNAAYFAGYNITQHRPHSVWFTRYPAGRESTLWGETINVVFENDTPYAAVLNSYVSGGRLYVDVWSTPHFTVETYASDKTNIREPGVKEVTSANCEAKGKGQPGFTITNTRKIFLDDEQVDEDSYTWTYAPDDAIKCVKEEDDD
ncbi:VanW family protein [Demequina sp. B12]|uniref:VanW family protein n=1 Tax=Demequina sp. B12 TaxID=2992757 RepID=UPI00237AFAB6|nr:VanW family protein [Demequina sp. B12]MDE0572632.1 VanW family protein [Demequina sp. B12]